MILSYYGKEKRFEKRVSNLSESKNKIEKSIEMMRINKFNSLIGRVDEFNYLLNFSESILAKLYLQSLLLMRYQEMAERIAANPPEKP